MENYICITCGTQYPASPAAPTHCPICEDDRQYINQNGQQWTTLAELRRERTNELTPVSYTHLTLPTILRLSRLLSFSRCQALHS